MFLFPGVATRASALHPIPAAAEKVSFFRRMSLHPGARLTAASPVSMESAPDPTSALARKALPVMRTIPLDSGMVMEIF